MKNWILKHCDLSADCRVSQQQAREAYRLFKVNPSHPSLKFKKLPPHQDLGSVRISNDYRAIGLWQVDVILWFFIGSHADYEKLISRL